MTTEFPTKLVCIEELEVGDLFTIHVSTSPVKMPFVLVGAPDRPLADYEGGRLHPPFEIYDDIRIDKDVIMCLGLAALYGDKLNSRKYLHNGNMIYIIALDKPAGTIVNKLLVESTSYE